MKKTLLSFAVIICITSSLSGQSLFGINAGTSISSFKNENDDGTSTDKSRSKVGFIFGILADLGISENFSIRPGLNFLQTGGIEEVYEIEGKITINNAEIPIDFIYKTNSTSGKFFFGAGPSITFSFSGKGKLKNRDTGEELTEEIKFGNSLDDDLKPVDVGSNFLAGFEFKSGLFIQGNYNMSFSNRSNAPDEIWKCKYLGIRFGYLFGGNKTK